MQRRLVSSSGDITSFYDGRSGFVGSSLSGRSPEVGPEDRGVGADRQSDSGSGVIMRRPRDAGPWRRCGMASLGSVSLHAKHSPRGVALRDCAMVRSRGESRS